MSEVSSEVLLPLATSDKKSLKFFLKRREMSEEISEKSLKLGLT
jgi:hypothetical protein